MTPRNKTGATYFAKLLLDMPDGWGAVYRPAIHPSSAGPPFCARYFLLRVLLGWDRRRWVESLYTGKVWHEIMALIRSSQTVLSACDGVLQSHTVEMERQIAEFRAEHPDEKAPLVDKSRKALALGAALARTWEEHFPPPAHWQVLAIEKRFRASLEHIGVGTPLEGTVDLVMFDPETQHVWLTDYKSAAFNVQVRAAGLTFEAQPLLYRDLWDRATPEYPLYGVIHNIIQKPTIRQRTKRQPETLDEYVQRCAEWFEEQALTHPAELPFGQSFIGFARPPLCEDTELCALLRAADRWYSRPPSLTNFPRCGKASSCIQFGRTCKFMPLCQQENPNRWHDILVRNGFGKSSPDEHATTEAAPGASQ